MSSPSVSAASEMKVPSKTLRGSLGCPQPLFGFLEKHFKAIRDIVLFFLFVLNSVKETETKMKHFPLFCEHLEVIRGAIQQAFKIFYVMLN